MLCWRGFERREVLHAGTGRIRISGVQCIMGITTGRGRTTSAQRGATESGFAPSSTTNLNNIFYLAFSWIKQKVCFEIPMLRRSTLPSVAQWVEFA